MAVPYNIHLLKFIAEAFGITLHGGNDQELMEAAVMVVGDVLGFSAAATLEFYHQAQSRISEYVAAQLASAGSLLSLDEVYTEIQGDMSSWFTISEDRVKELADRFGIFLEAQARVPVRELGPLAIFVAQVWTVRNFTAPYNSEITREAHFLVVSLLTRRPEETRRALSVWRPFPDDFEPQGRHLLQVQGRIAYNATNRLTEPPLDPLDLKGLREYRLNLLDAWVLAYETTMFHVCRFLWLAKRKLRDDADLGQMPTKGCVYNEIIAWCKDDGFEFPFYEKAVRLRNNGAHGSCVLDSRRDVVLFLDKNGDVVGELPQHEVQSAAEHDIAMANLFFQGVILARLSQDNLSGRFDRLWGIFKRQVPDLRTVLDLGVTGNTLFGEPSATREQVVEYLAALPSFEFLKLMTGLRLAWAQPSVAPY